MATGSAVSEQQVTYSNNVMMQNFVENVLEASKEIPILVDFWAPWCGPCRVLGPVLEKLSQEQSDRWRLVKINTDENPELSAEYGIRGIPAVKLFVDGKVVDEFTGALPEHALKQWLDKAIPTEESVLIDDAAAAFDEGNVELAKQLYERAIESNAADIEAKIGLAKIIVWDDPDRAQQLVQGFTEAPPGVQILAKSVDTISSLLSSNDFEKTLPDGPGREHVASAVNAIREKDFATATQELISALTKDRYYHDDLPRKVGVALFTVLGQGHEVTKAKRRTFDMMLY